MNCPFCGEEMEEGKVEHIDRGYLRWCPEEIKYSLVDRLEGKGRVKFEDTFPYSSAHGYYCYKCEKLILDTKIKK